MTMKAVIIADAGTFVRKIIIPSVAVNANGHTHAYFGASVSVQSSVVAIGAPYNSLQNQTQTHLKTKQNFHRI